MQLTLVSVLALLSAVLSAGATVCILQGLQRSNSHTGYWINLVVGVTGLWIAVFLLTPHDVAFSRAIPFFVLSGLVGTVGGRFTRFIGIEKVGASVSASINNLHPFISSVLALLLLGEQVTPAIIIGTCVIVLGTICLSLTSQQIGFRPRHLIYPFMAAAFFGVSAIIRKLGLSETGPIFGAAVNMTTALIAFTSFLVVSGRSHALRCHGRSLWYFVAAGVAENAGVCLVIVALSLGQVSIVAPLAGTAPLFVLPMTYFFLKGIESLTWKIVLGVLLIVAGVVLLTSSS